MWLCMYILYYIKSSLSSISYILLYLRLAWWLTLGGLVQRKRGFAKLYRRFLFPFSSLNFFLFLWTSTKKNPGQFFFSIYLSSKWKKDLSFLWLIVLPLTFRIIFAWLTKRNLSKKKKSAFILFLGRGEVGSKNVFL